MIGITGGIASGKTVVADRLRALGYAVLDADQYAREAIEPHTPPDGNRCAGLFPPRLWGRAAGLIGPNWPRSSLPMPSSAKAGTDHPPPLCHN